MKGHENLEDGLERRVIKVEEWVEINEVELIRGKGLVGGVVNDHGAKEEKIWARREIETEKTMKTKMGNNTISSRLR